MLCFLQIVVLQPARLLGDSSVDTVSRSDRLNEANVGYQYVQFAKDKHICEHWTRGWAGDVSTYRCDSSPWREATRVTQGWIDRKRVVALRIDKIWTLIDDRNRFKDEEIERSDRGRIVTEEEDVGVEEGAREVEGQTWHDKHRPWVPTSLRPFVFPHHNCFFFFFVC